MVSGGIAKRVADDFARVPDNRITNQSEFSTLVQKKMTETWVMTATGIPVLKLTLTIEFYSHCLS